MIIADEIDGEALATLVVNKLKGGLALCAVKSPGFGDRRKAILQDIAVLTGATVVSEEVGLLLEEVDVNVLGSAKTVKISKEEDNHRRHGQASRDPEEGQPDQS